MARGDATFACVDCDWFLHPKNIAIGDNNARSLFLFLWCLAVRERATVLPKEYNGHFFTRLLDPMTIEEYDVCIKILSSAGLIVVHDDGSILVVGVEKKHPKLGFKNPQKNSNDLKRNETISNDLKRSQTISNDLKRSQKISNDLKRSQMISNDLKKSQTISNDLKMHNAQFEAGIEIEKETEKETEKENDNNRQSPTGSIALPLAGTSQKHIITSDKLSQYEKLYGDYIDVSFEARRVKQYLMDRKDKQGDKSKNLNLLSYWLNKEFQKAKQTGVKRKTRPAKPKEKSRNDVEMDLFREFSDSGLTGFALTHAVEVELCRLKLLESNEMTTKEQYDSGMTAISAITNELKGNRND